MNFPLTTAFAAFCKFGYISISFASRHFLISHLTSSLTHSLLSVLVNLHISVNCPVFFLDHFNHLQVYSSVALNTLTMLCITTLQFQNFFIFPKKNSIPVKHQFPFSLHPASGNHHSVSTSINVTNPEKTYKWNQSVCLFVCFFLIGIMFTWFPHVEACIKISFLFKAK